MHVPRILCKFDNTFKLELFTQERMLFCIVFETFIILDGYIEYFLIYTIINQNNDSAQILLNIKDSYYNYPKVLREESECREFNPGI